MTRTGPYRPEADDHLTGTRALQQRHALVLDLHTAERIATGYLWCRVCHTAYPCTTVRLLEPRT